MDTGDVWVTGPARPALGPDHAAETRAEIGNDLGMTLETVSRALSKLARDTVIDFAEKGRRDIRIPDVEALSGFVQRCLAPAPTLQ
jgi:CRP/FNR family transcriptional regulator, anaerobic regulatory protein